MPVPSYLIDQEEEYIRARGFTFRDFSAEQVIDALKLKSMETTNNYKMDGHMLVKSTSIAGGKIWKKVDE